MKVLMSSSAIAIVLIMIPTFAVVSSSAYAQSDQMSASRQAYTTSTTTTTATPINTNNQPTAGEYKDNEPLTESDLSNAQTITEETDPLPTNAGLDPQTASRQPYLIAQEYEYFRNELRAQGFLFQDSSVMYTTAWEGNTKIVKVFGLPGVTAQPPGDVLAEVGQAYGYVLIDYGTRPDTGEVVVTFMEAM